MNKSPGRWIAPGIIIGAILLGLVPLVGFALFHRDDSVAGFDPSLLGILWFTLKQAFLSSIISVGTGFFAARALARRNFPGQDIVLGLFGMPLALPAIVVVLAITRVYGAQGWLGGWVNIYGLNGILLAHVFFNLPLATRLMLEALRQIAPENIRLSEQLGLSDLGFFRHVEWPILRHVMPRIFALIFLLCAASFVIVLTLGGPSATTLEVAIYQSLRQDFDVSRALDLSALQIMVCLVLVVISGRLELHAPTLAHYQRRETRRDGVGWPSRIMDFSAIAAAIAFMVPPAAALVLAGFVNIQFNAQAMGTSLMLGAGSALISVALAWTLARDGGIGLQVTSLAALIVPPAVLATGWFLLLRPVSDSKFIVVASIVALNALMTLPFATSLLAPAFAQVARTQDRLCLELGIQGWARFWHIDVRSLKRPLIQAFLMAFVFSLGDLTAITLLGTQGLITMPVVIHQQMGHYRGHEADGSALVLAGFCYGLTLVAQRLGKPG